MRTSCLNYIKNFFHNVPGEMITTERSGGSRTTGKGRNFIKNLARQRIYLETFLPSPWKWDTLMGMEKAEKNSISEGSEKIMSNVMFKDVIFQRATASLRKTLSGAAQLPPRTRPRLEHVSHSQQINYDDSFPSGL